MSLSQKTEIVFGIIGSKSSYSWLTSNKTVDYKHQQQLQNTVSFYNSDHTSVFLTTISNFPEQDIHRQNVSSSK